MAYVLSSQQRGYVKKESAEGTVPSLAAADAFRFASLSLVGEQDYIQRRDKLGHRTFLGVVAGGRRRGSWSMDGHLVPNGAAGTAPDMDPFFEAAMGGAQRNYAGGTTHASTPSTTTSIVFNAAQNLIVGDAIGFGGELRFVTAITAGTAGAATTVTVDPAFATAPGLGAAISGSSNFPLGTNLPTLSIASYQDPAAAQQLIINMCVAERLRIAINGDTHDVSISGNGQQLIDSITFVNPTGGLTSFPVEPTSPVTNGVPIAGHYGQVWIGSPIAKFASLQAASLELANGVIMREREFGSQVPLGHAEGVRSISAELDLFEQDNADTTALMTAAKNRTAIKLYFQLGTTLGQIFAAYMSAVILPLPGRSDDQENVRWTFAGARAQGSSANSELYLSFG